MSTKLPILELRVWVEGRVCVRVRTGSPAVHGDSTDPAHCTATST